jgi:hypothetical protein
VVDSLSKQVTHQTFSRACFFLALLLNCRHTVRSRFVVVAVPLGVLQGRAKGAAIAFNPPLPDDKLEAIHRLGYGVENKAFLEFDVKQRFWPVNQPYVTHWCPATACPTMCSAMCHAFDPSWTHHVLQTETWL